MGTLLLGRVMQLPFLRIWAIEVIVAYVEIKGMARFFFHRYFIRYMGLERSSMTIFIFSINSAFVFLTFLILLLLAFKPFIRRATMSLVCNSSLRYTSYIFLIKYNRKFLRLKAAISQNA